MSKNESENDQYTAGIDRRCDTDDCHRQASHVVTYNVYGGGSVRQESRDSCEPCINAMKFRETFAWADGDWNARSVGTERVQ